MRIAIGLLLVMSLAGCGGDESDVDSQWIAQPSSTPPADGGLVRIPQPTVRAYPGPRVTAGAQTTYPLAPPATTGWVGTPPGTPPVPTSGWVGTPPAPPATTTTVGTH